MSLTFRHRKSSMAIMVNKYHAFIKSLRTERGFSQLEIAKKLGISRSSYIAFEQGRRELAMTEANELGKIFEISLDDIQNGKISVPEVIFEKSKKIKKIKGIGNDVWERVSIPQERVEKFKQAVLYKLLYFIDFDYYEKFEEQLIGARYIKNTHGPTPVAFTEIINDLEEEGKIETIKSKFYKYEQTKYLINPTKPLELSELSGQEIAHIDWEINRLSDFTASQISALSHKDTPWLVAKERGILNYEHVFYRPEETSVREYEPL